MKKYDDLIKKTKSNNELNNIQISKKLLTTHKKPEKEEIRKPEKIINKTNFKKKEHEAFKNISKACKMFVTFLNTKYNIPIPIDSDSD